MAKITMIYNHLKDILPAIQNPVIIEIGAHIGSDTDKILSFCHNVEYYAIEPDERNHPMLRKVLDNHRLKGHFISLINYAISDQNGLSTFYLSQGKHRTGNRELTDCNSLLKPLGNHPLRFRESIISTGKLDTLLGFLSYVTLIWADIQGSELAMIKGATEILKRTNYLYLECQTGRYHNRPTKQQLLNQIPEFEQVFFDGGNVFLRRKS